MVHKSLELLYNCANKAVNTRIHSIYNTLSNSNVKESFLKAVNFHKKEYNFNEPYKRNCENMIGVVTVPVGIIQDFRIGGRDYNIPFATTEGTLVASISRGVKVLNLSGGVSFISKNNGISRGILIETESMLKAYEINIDSKENYFSIKKIFDSASSHCSLQNIIPYQMGKDIHLRFQCTTGSAMGMNIISKCVEKVWNDYYSIKFPDARCLSISGNTCTDKKFNSMNWIRGRGYETHVESIVKKDILKEVLRVTPDDLISLNIKKNFIGSSIAGTVGGNNCHASNILSGIYLATGQDIAQIGTSSMCILNLEKYKDDLYCSLRLPCMELATLGGGTNLEPQKSYLDFINLSNKEDSSELAGIIGSCVLAGEISLLSALKNMELVKSHLKFNRK